jgi:hypothetical protein
MIGAIVSRYASIVASLYANDVTGVNSDTTGSRAPDGARPNRNSLRYLPPWGLVGAVRTRPPTARVVAGRGILTAELADALANLAAGGAN